MQVETSPASDRVAAPSPPPVQRKKRQATTAACGPCRKRKSKCDGERPKCSACIDRKTDCGFDTQAAETHAQALKRKFNELQAQQSTYEHIYDILQARPKEEAEEVFQRIRRGADAHSILRQVSHGDLLVQLALKPEARFRYEFPYSSEMPAFLCRQDNMYLASEMYACVLQPQPPHQHQGQQRQSQRRKTSWQQLLLTSEDSTDVSSDTGQGRDPYLKPYHGARVIHPLLETVKPSDWTKISSDDGLMRKLLHDYLLYEHGWFTMFHIDVFLQDMADRRNRFCSSLMVNLVLALGTHYHRGLPNRTDFWDSNTIGYKFLAEAKRLFEIELEVEKPLPNDPGWESKHREWHQRKLVSIQAAVLLNIAYSFNGADKFGWRYICRAVEIADEIHLFRTSHENFGFEIQSVRNYTAWALFCFQSLYCYHLFRPPLVKKPPESPLPDPVAFPQWYGEIWVRYPLSQSRSSTHHGPLFKAKADMWTIMHDFTLICFRDSASPLKLSMDQILGFYNRLVAWFDNLPEPLTPKNISMPHHLKLHMHYNLVLMNILKLITPRDWRDYTQLGYRLPIKSPRIAYEDARMHYETTIRLYYLRHGFDVLDGFILHFLGSLSEMTIEAINSNSSPSIIEALRSTVLLTAKGFYDQAQSIYVARAVFRLQTSMMRPEDVELLKYFAKIEVAEEIRTPLEQPVQSIWPTYDHPLGIEGISENPSNTLTRRLEGMSLEFTPSPGPSGPST
ncbi:hypothetical protein B0T17DRAFT_490691 [Bombardia bombarda]|uniref:Zn(2)-C6 fungal-type domain-containing protein n=1 Tax=Bombardia bombarda TaxID=252184 RepID=A0AA40C9G8_9PEZI|nr:hypothetical protein B0T17DRAFT_490691 [Bombardia bombarda]